MVKQHKNLCFSFSKVSTRKNERNNVIFSPSSRKEIVYNPTSAEQFVVSPPRTRIETSSWTLHKTTLSPGWNFHPTGNSLMFVLFLFQIGEPEKNVVKILPVIAAETAGEKFIVFHVHESM